MSIVRTFYKEFLRKFFDEQILSAKASLAKIAIQVLFQLHQYKEVTSSIKCLPSDHKKDETIPTKKAKALYPDPGLFYPDTSTKYCYPSPYNGTLSPGIKNVPNTFIKFGPSHPATRDGFRLFLDLEDKIVKSKYPYIGFLHQLNDQKTYTQTPPYLNSLNSTFCMSKGNGNSHSLAVKLLQFKDSQRVSVLECSQNTPLIWQFKEHRKLFESFEHVSVYQLSNIYNMQPVKVASDIPIDLMESQYELRLKYFGKLTESNYSLRTINGIFIPRAIDLDKFSCHDDISLLRSRSVPRTHGVIWILCKVQSCDGCQQSEYDVPMGIYGDFYDRFLCRVEETPQYLCTMDESLIKMSESDIKFDDHKIYPPKRCEMKTTSMKDQTHHSAPRYLSPPVQMYGIIKFPKDEFGMYLISNDTSRP